MATDLGVRQCQNRMKPSKMRNDQRLNFRKTAEESNASTGIVRLILTENLGNEDTLFEDGAQEPHQ